MSDLISRREAIDALVKAIRKDPYYDSNEAINGLGVCDVRVILNDLPSAQPEIEERKEESAQNVPKEDLISRKEAIDALDSFILDETTNLQGDSVREILESLPSSQPMPQWIPVSERLPEEDHWLGGSGKQFSDNVLISITNREDADAWSDISQTIDGEWALELPRHCKITAWMPLPEPYRAERRTDDLQ